MIETVALLAVGTAQIISLDTLLAEMTDRSALARWPAPSYEALQATSYNRESKRRGEAGWFADSDGTGFIRVEGEGENREYVLMEHDGPGCITRLWTPFFYYDFNERTGPNVRIYLDGSKTPVIDESLIRLVTGKGSVPGPLAAYTARAGDLYLPIPFAKSAKVTMKAKPFYFSIAYRGYPAGTRVESFRPEMLRSHRATLETAAKALVRGTKMADGPLYKSTLAPGATARMELPRGSHALEDLTLDLAGAFKDPSILRSTVLSASFDGEETIWCPIGDYFCSADSLSPYSTVTRTVRGDGRMSSRWIMPYRRTGQIRITNHGRKPLTFSWRRSVETWRWDPRSMHFYARWRPDDLVPGSPFSDWNFVDIQGRGVYVGDAWTVLNIRRDSWWGEGDEKVYVDDAWRHGFPTHFGTGSEDYYGWAGGVLPVREDEFSTPFQANVKVGGLDGHTLGYNILTRVRGLDAIPFRSRLRFDMESSFGTDMRERWSLLGYSAVTFWYAFPGARHNRPPAPTMSRIPIMSVVELQKRSDEIRAEGNR